MRYCCHFLIKAEGGADNCKRDHRLLLARRFFTVILAQRKGYNSFQNEKKISTREVGFHLSLKLKKRCIVAKKRATEVS